MYMKIISTPPRHAPLVITLMGRCHARRGARAIRDECDATTREGDASERERERTRESERERGDRGRAGRAGPNDRPTDRASERTRSGSRWSRRPWRMMGVESSFASVDDAREYETRTRDGIASSSFGTSSSWRGMPGTWTVVTVVALASDSARASACVRVGVWRRGAASRLARRPRADAGCAP